MKRVLDKFSSQSSRYKKFRPRYPTGLYDFILSKCHLLADIGYATSCWDCGTGNGQVAGVIARSFNEVFATDISEAQIAKAPSIDNIYYSVERAERTSFNDGCFDLVTVAQAVHWFDLSAFYDEVGRVLKPHGVLAIWGYGLLRITPEIDRLIDDFYNNIIGPYWDEERRHIDQKYESIGFDTSGLTEIKTPQDFMIKKTWSLYHLRGYLNSWSGVQNYMFANNGTDPVGGLIDQLSSYWDSRDKEVTFSIFLKMGKSKGFKRSE